VKKIVTERGEVRDEEKEKLENKRYEIQ